MSTLVGFFLCWFFLLPAAGETWRIGLVVNDYPYFDDVGPQQSRGAADNSPLQDATSVDGLYAEFWREIARSGQAHVEFVSCKNEASCLHLLKTEKIDLLGPRRFVNAEQLVFTKPVIRRYTVAAAIKPNSVESAVDLTGARVAITSGSDFERMAVEAWQPKALDVTSAQAGARSLVSGGIDYLILSGASKRTFELASDVTLTSLWFRWEQIYALESRKALIKRIDMIIDQREDLQSLHRQWLPIQREAGFLSAENRPTVDFEVLKFLDAKPTVKLGASNWEPLTTRQGKVYDGIALRVVNYHFTRAGITPVFVGDEDWMTVMARARKGRYDGLGFMMSTSAPDMGYLTTEPLASIQVVAISATADEYLADLSDLSGKTVLIHPAYTSLTAEFSDLSMKLEYEADASVAITKLKSGYADAWVEYLPIARDAIHKTDSADSIRSVLNLNLPHNLYTLLNSQWHVIMPLLNWSASTSRKESLDTVYKEWIDRNETRESIRVIASPVLLIAIAILFFVLTFLSRYLLSAQRTSRERERAMTRAQLLSGVGSFELRKPYDQVLLDGATPRLLGLMSHHTVQTLDEHIALFEKTNTTQQAFDDIITSDVPIYFEAVRRSQPQQIFTYELAPRATVGGRAGVITGTLKNVTEQRAQDAHEKELEHQVLQLQKLDAVGQLAHGIAHDFNNILAISKAHNELVLGELDALHPAKSHVEQMSIATERAIDLVQQLLMFGRHQSKEHKVLQWQPCLFETIGLLRGSIPASVRIITDLCDEPVWVKGDEGQLSQVIVNLVTNAVDALEKDGEIIIALTATNGMSGSDNGAQPNEALIKPSYARLTIIDNGRGIDPEFVDRVFDPFFTTKEIGKGTGLGLSMVHGVLRAHQGTIKVAPNPGGGTQFTINLPTTDPPAVENASMDVIETTGGNGGRIMLIDDEPMLAKVIERVLTVNGFSVNTFASATDAIVVLMDDPDQYDLVLTDLTMPDLSGIDFAKRVRSSGSSIPIVLFSGYDAEVASAELGLFSRMLQKPVPNKALIAAVNEALH